VMAPTEERPASRNKWFHSLPLVGLGIWFSAGVAFVINGILLAQALLHPASGSMAG